MNRHSYHLHPCLRATRPARLIPTPPGIPVPPGIAASTTNMVRR